MADYGFGDIFDADPDLPFMKARAQSAALARRPLLSTPSSGVEVPPARPGASPVADYRAKALEALTQSQTYTPSPEEKQATNEKTMLALTLGAMGGESFRPAAGLLLKQSLADPEAARERHQKRLEAQARLYESMAQNADTVEQRREAAAQADETRRLLLQQSKFVPIKDQEGNVTAVVNTHTGEVLGGGAGGAPATRPDALPKTATSEERNRYGIAAETITSSNRLIKEIEANPDAFGLGAGSAAGIGASTGIPVQKLFLTPEQEQLRAGVMNKAYEIIKSLAGTALSATEAGRIMQFAPNPRDDATTITSKMRSAIQLARDSRTTLRQRYRIPTPPDEEVQQPTPAPAPAAPQASVQQRADSYYHR